MPGGGVIKKMLSRSPLVMFALAASGWSFTRLFIYKAGIGPRRPAPFDLPIVMLSPIATEYNMGLTLSLITAAGIIASFVAFFRKQEAWRPFGIVTIGLNLLAWWWMTELAGWAFNPPPGIDY